MRGEKFHLTVRQSAVTVKDNAYRQATSCRMSTPLKIKRSPDGGIKSGSDVTRNKKNRALTRVHNFLSKNTRFEIVTLDVCKCKCNVNVKDITEFGGSPISLNFQTLFLVKYDC